MVLFKAITHVVICYNSLRIDTDPRKYSAKQGDPRCAFHIPASGKLGSSVGSTDITLAKDLPGEQKVYLHIGALFPKYSLPLYRARLLVYFHR